MWTKQQTATEAPVTPSVPGSGSPVVPFSTPSAVRLGNTAARNSARLGSGLHIKGQITGTEDLQIDGKVEGPISLRGHQLIGVSPRACLAPLYLARARARLPLALPSEPAAAGLLAAIRASK